MLRGILGFAALLHFAFMAGEMLPPGTPFILERVLTNRSIQFDTETEQQKQQLMSTIVRNAGIYNFIVAMGFVWCCKPNLLGVPLDKSALRQIRIFFLAAAVVAGLFGVFTLERTILVQVVVGVVGLAAVFINKE